VTGFGSPNITNSQEGVLILAAFRNALDSFNSYINNADEDQKIPKELSEAIIEKLEKILEMSENYIFTARDSKNYWQMNYQALITYVYKLDNNRTISEKESYELLILLDRVIEFLLSYAHEEYLKEEKYRIDNLLNQIDVSAKQVENDVNRYMRLRNVADNARTESIYNNAVTKYQDLEKIYRKYFYFAIGIILVVSILLLFFKSYLVTTYLSNYEFWAIKVSTLLVGITLISYFLKQSSHYQRLADQNYQTQVELQAYPSFMESIPTEEAASVRKELALKYFGREIDGATHKDMSNLISDQMKNTTDMVKATTEAIKNLK